MKVSKVVILGFAILFISTMTISTEPNLLDSNANIAVHSEVVLSYTTRSPVLIQNNTDFVTQAWSGFGNSSHPYKFSGYDITSDDTCMHIHNTTAFFEISDCLFDSVSGRSSTGVNLYNVSNGLITNCTFTSKYLGLDIQWSNSTNVTGNVFDDCDYGFLNRHASFHNIFHNNTLVDITYAIYIYQDYNTTVTFNCVFNCGYAIFAREGVEDFFVNNTIYDCTSYGIYTRDSQTMTLENNSIGNSGTGVYLRSSLSCNLTNNIFTDNGMFIASDNDNVLDWNHTVNDNLVNGKALGYFWNATMTDYSGGTYGQIILANCSSVNVNGGIFHDSTYGVLIGYGFNCSVSDSTIYGNRYGIYVISSENTTLDNNEVYESSLSGISIRISDLSIVSNVNVHDSGYDGIQVYSGNWNTIKDSMIYDNGQYGITLNNIPGFDDARYNIIYNNTIGWNSNNADDSSGDSWFDDLGRGNAWSDYNGVGDYNVPPSGSADHYPSRALYLEDISNVTVAYGTTGNELNWSATADRPNVFEIYKDDVIIEDDLWNGSSLFVSLDGLTEGIYNFTIFVNHTTGHSTNDTVWVHVIDDTDPPTINEPDNIIIPYGQLGEEISWIGIDETPVNYIVYRNNSVFETGPWTNNTEIEISLNGFNIGAYNMTIILFDSQGRNVTDTVWVTVEPSGYTSHPNIYIYGNDDFITQAGNEGWPGDGSKDNPFIIQWYEITTSGTCITIHDVSLYFVIQDCVLYSGYIGISLSDTDYVIVESCYIESLTIGIEIGSDHCEFYNITIVVSSYYDVDMRESTNNTFTDCIFSKGFQIIGYSVEEWRHNMDWVNHHNTINGKRFCYLFNEDYSTVEGTEWGQIIIVNSTGVIVRNVDISGVHNGIVLSFAMECEIYDSSFSNNEIGVLVLLSNDTFIHDIVVLNNGWTGIELNMTGGSFLFNNTINYNSENGILLGMENQGAISNNTLLHNKYGILGWCSSNMVISNNTIKFSIENGISIYDFTLFQIMSNKILNNTGIGIEIGWGCEDYTIYWNEIGWNDGGNALDDGEFTYWDDGSDAGNYWSDFTPPAPYSIIGDAGSMDRYPSLLESPAQLDAVLPTLDQPLDIEYSEGTTSHSISWNPEDEFPSSYEVFRNGSSIASGLWNSSSESVVADIDGLSMGVYNFTLLVRDAAGNEAVDTVFVTVVDDTAPTMNHPIDITYTEGAVGNSFTWTPTDAHPGYYEIYRNDTLFSTAGWTAGTNILIVVDGLSAGTWNYTIVVYDSSGNSAGDTVMVNVNEVSTTPTDTTPTDTTPTGTDPTNTTTPDVNPEFLQILMFTVTIGSVVVIIVFVVMIFRSRR